MLFCLCIQVSLLYMLHLLSHEFSRLLASFLHCCSQWVAVDVTELTSLAIIIGEDLLTGTKPNRTLSS